MLYSVRMLMSSADAQDVCRVFQYPLSELVRLLAFEDGTEAREFCEHHGLTVTSDGLVHMGKMGFVDPEVAFPMRRAARLIQSKQTASLGQVSWTFKKMKFIAPYELFPVVDWSLGLM